MMRFILVLLYYATCVLSSNDNSNPTIIIIGAGPAGIAAASRLFQNGFNNITILEAENRIGGRVYSEYMVDLGGQWVHGEKNNVAFELAWPLGLIERFNVSHESEVKIFGSSGSSLSLETSQDLRQFLISLDKSLTDVESLKTGSFGEYADAKFEEYYKNHPEINVELHKPLRDMMNLGQMASDAADNWYEVSAKSLQDYPECEGDNNINWKNQTYSTILDILMKKIPNPEEELPILNNTHTNSKITKINYNEESTLVKVSAADGKEYLADHVIFTPSLGVLKANHNQLFNPPLPEKKIKSIENLGFGHVAKILLYFDNPWWHTDDNKLNVKLIYWTEADRKEIENDPERKWMLGIFSLFPIEHKPKLLCIWMSSNHSTEMESIPEELFHNQTSEFLNRFFGHEYNITKISAIQRTLWNTNENFRGTYSYHGVETDAANVTNADLAEPITRDNKPILQFAGEATSEHYSTVNGAIESGWREADRLINLYSNKN
ncbi:hypothetical protein PV325_006126 [Microctonus aethiopoides]|nr:hypothetical protein PV325_006126 [Microctonus aethiopoides]